MTTPYKPGPEHKVADHKAADAKAAADAKSAAKEGEERPPDLRWEVIFYRATSGQPASEFFMAPDIAKAVTAAQEKLEDQVITSVVLAP